MEISTAEHEVSTVDTVHLAVPAHPAELADLRRRVTSHLAERGASPELVEDTSIIVSELATNVVEHSDSSVISVGLSGEDDRWVLTVADAEQVPAVGSLALVDVEAIGGRGLYIVQALARTVDVSTVEGVVVVRCTLGA